MKSRQDELRHNLISVAGWKQTIRKNVAKFTVPLLVLSICLSPCPPRRLAEATVRGEAILGLRHTSAATAETTTLDVPPRHRRGEAITILGLRPTFARTVGATITPAALRRLRSAGASMVGSGDHPLPNTHSRGSIPVRPPVGRAGDAPAMWSITLGLWNAVALTPRATCSGRR
jgi:hypothetical protein